MNTQPRRHDHTDQPWLGHHLEQGLPPLAPSAGRASPAAPRLHDQPLFGALRQTMGTMTLDLQPRHGLADGVLCAAGASLRGGPPLAATNDPDLALRLGGWLLETACQEAQEWSALRCQPAIAVSIEMPACLLRKDRLAMQAKHALARSGLQPELLEILLPERVATQGDTDLVLTLSALREAGIGLGLDHFGTLAASPRALQRLPLSFVKLDLALTRDIVACRDSRAAVKAACALAHALGASVLATHVENVTQRDILADLGCDTGQGRIFGGTVRPEIFHAALLVPSLRQGR